MANITISYSEVLFDLRNKNKEEVRFIQEPQARYLAEARTDKSDEVSRCIKEAFSQVASLYVRFVKNDFDADATDDLGSIEDLSLVLELSERRSYGKAQVIADTIHSLVVNHALSKFYNTIQQPDLAAKRAALAMEDTKLLNKLFFEKLPPEY